MKVERNLLIAFILNLSFAVFECLGGVWTGSVAILSDSLHDLIDALMIGLSFFLEKKSRLPADSHYTYGYRRLSVLGALVNSLAILGSSLATLCFALGRLWQPQAVNSQGMLLIAIVGIVVNYLAFATTHHRHSSLNQKAVNLHLFEDLAGWITVLLGAVVIRFTGLTWLDPVLSIGICLYLLYEAWGNLTAVGDIILLKSPLDSDKISAGIQEVAGVTGVHHLHVWSLDGEQNLVTAHIVAPVSTKKAVKKKLRALGVDHSVLEFESLDEHCNDHQCHPLTTVH